MDKIPNEKLIDEIKKFLRRINKRFKIKKAILFGSRARDDWLYSSDVDLIIVSDDFIGIDFLDRISIVLKYWTLPIKLEPICYTSKEFNYKKNQIGTIRKATKEGKIISI